MLLVARVHLARGDFDDAEAILAKIVGDRDRLRGGAAWAWMAVARLGRGDVEGARTAARVALAIDREDPVALYALSLTRACPAGCRPAPDLSAGRGTPSPRGSR